MKLTPIFRESYSLSKPAAARLFLLLAGLIPASATCQPAAAPVEPARVEPELLLTLSTELSTEIGNRAAIAGRIVHTHWLQPGDQLEVIQRFSQISKDTVFKYAAPTNRLGFSLVSHEVRLADLQQYIAANRKYQSQQFSYRNLYGRQTGIGLWGVSWGVEATRLDTTEQLAPHLADFVARQGKTSVAVPLQVHWGYDRRAENSILPKGHYDQAMVEWGTPAGNTRYFKVDYSHASFWPVVTDVSLGFNAALGHIRGLSGDLTPINKRFYGGGVGSVRGYETGSLGPLDSSGAVMGASSKAQVSVEALWHAFSIGPTPVIMGIFSEYGDFHGAENSLVSGVHASSYGVSVSLPMPIGLARFSFAKPKVETDRGQHFQFDLRSSWK